MRRMGGFDRSRFKGSNFHRNFLCPICGEVLKDPVQRVDCDHHFCRECITQWLKTSKTCPIDRQPLACRALRLRPRLITSLMSNLDIACEFASVGCHAIVKLERLEDHSKVCLPYLKAVVNKLEKEKRMGETLFKQKEKEAKEKEQRFKDEIKALKEERKLSCHLIETLRQDVKRLEEAAEDPSLEQISAPEQKTEKASVWYKFKFAFNELNDYCLLELFKYLSLKERTRLERVEKRWAQSLDRIWLKEKVLVFDEDRIQRRRVEPFSFISFDDVFHVLDVSISVDKILEKAKNLIALTKIPFLSQTKLIKIISRHPRLEHLSLPLNSNLNEVFKASNGSQVRLKCLHFNAVAEMDFMSFDYKSLENLMKTSLFLEELHFEDHQDFQYKGNHLNMASLITSLSPVFPRLKSFKLDILIHCSLFIFNPLIDKLIELGTNLETISFRGDDENAKDEEQRMRRLILKCPKLTFIEWIGWRGVIEPVVSSNRIEHISWLPPNEPNVNWLLAENENLKTLMLEYGAPNEPNIEVIPNFFPNLMTLKIDLFELKSIPLELFSSLKQLRRLVLMRAKVGDEAVQCLLGKCTKLREVNLNECQGLSTEIFNYFKTFARLHPKRLIKLYLGIESDGKPRNAPDVVFEKNLRIYFG